MRYFQTLFQFTRDDSELAVTALRDRFCNPPLQELHVTKPKKFKIYSKTCVPQKFFVIFQTKAMNTYRAPDPPALSPVDAHAAAAAAEQTRLDQDTARNGEVIRPAQEV